ncbi:TPR-like protein [Macrolepiota fuliginosa MF-IS2]|uniref:TPR-like protein n=1 Tax=Macrolepiota fuliginosa MF-IS2 TaxID=1400762 RepID=A0A9P5XHP7_9AGAR|nr:TPR-like protein [Macrolepiota fuliginosa MF-IS2]
MANSPAPSFLERAQDFVVENKRAILIGTAAVVVAVGSVAYYASTSRQRTVKRNVGKGEEKDKKKGKKKGTSRDGQGPILEEWKAKVQATEVDVEKLSAEDIVAKSEEERAEIAATFKQEGNNAYKSSNYSEAAEYYTKAIQISPKPESTMRLLSAVRHFTAATVLDTFQNRATTAAVERVLKKLSTAKAVKIIKGREPRLPSHTFVSTYFAAFRERSLPTLSADPTQGDETLLLGLQALKASNYPHAVMLINEAIDQGISTSEGKAEAFNLRGTFKFLMVLFIMNEFDDAVQDYTKSTEFDDTFVFSHIQLAVAQYKTGKIANGIATFRRTIKTFPNRSEPQNYYGELLLDQGRFEDAIERFDKAIELEKSRSPQPPNVLSLVNKGLAMYQWKQDIGTAERCCNEALRIDPECEAAVATLAQLNLQQNRIEEAVEMFEWQAGLARGEPELVNALTYQYVLKAQLELSKTYPEMAEQLSQIVRAMA